MQQHKSFILGDHFEKFISDELSSGKYNSASDVVKAGLVLLEAEHSKKQHLIDALVEGEQSGFVENYDPMEHLKKLNATLR